MKALAKYAERIDALSIRERGFIFIAVLGVLYAAWEVTLFSPLDARRDALVAQVDRLSEEITVLHAQTSQLAMARSRDPDVDDRGRLAAAREETAALRTRLERITDSLVPPREMSRLLEAVLTRETRLDLVSLEGLGVQPVLVADPADVDAAPTAAEAVAAPTLFKHGLRVEFEGGYLDTLEYLRALEELSWGFLWDSVHFEVGEYPRARVSITVFSLSLENAWIGV